MVYLSYLSCIKGAQSLEHYQMGRPKGVKNKTPQELKIEAELLKRKAEMKELEHKRKELQKQRRS